MALSRHCHRLRATMPRAAAYSLDLSQYELLKIRREGLASQWRRPRAPRWDILMSFMEHFSEIWLFKGMSPEHSGKLASIASEETVARGGVVFSEGDEGNGFYAVISGQVRVYKLSLDGKEQTLHVFGPGEIFGEVPVFAGGQFPAHAAALKKSRILFFPRQPFIDLIHEDPSLALNMLAVLSQRLRQFTTLVESLSLKAVPSRLAAYLLYLAEHSKDPENVSLDISKVQLASLLGTIPETLSRVLGKMGRQGLIQSTGSRTIRLLDGTGLEELARGERK